MERKNAHRDSSTGRKEINSAYRRRIRPRARGESTHPSITSLPGVLVYARASDNARCAFRAGTRVYLHISSRNARFRRARDRARERSSTRRVSGPARHIARNGVESRGFSQLRELKYRVAGALHKVTRFQRPLPARTVKRARARDERDPRSPRNTPITRQT